MKLRDFVERISDVLEIGNFYGSDPSQNGLQVGDLDADICKVAFAVDASLATIKEAIEQNADVLFVHHGLFWGNSLVITGRHYERISTMIRNNLALVACHLPLDAHLTYGNNAQMAMKLGLLDVEPFAKFRGVYEGVKGRFPAAVTAQEIIRMLGVRENHTNFELNCSGKKFRTVGIVSGGGAGDVYTAMDEKLDLLITGESRYSTINDCLEDDMSMLCLGHYETETFGVRAMMEMVGRELGLQTCFIDIPLGL